jgi:hypothetical protein
LNKDEKLFFFLAWFNAISFQYFRFVMHCLNKPSDSTNHVWQVVHIRIVVDLYGCSDWLCNTDSSMHRVHLKLAAYPARLQRPLCNLRWVTDGHSPWRYRTTNLPENTKVFESTGKSTISPTCSYQAGDKQQL